MAAKQGKWNEQVTLAKGVSINADNGRTPKVRVSFALPGHGLRREDLGTIGAGPGEWKGDKLTALGVRNAQNAVIEAHALLVRVKRAIEEQSLPGGKKFVYRDFFPNSRFNEKIGSIASPDKVNVGEMLDAYIAEIESTSLAASTINGYKTSIENWIRPYWGKRSADQITHDTVEDWLKAIRDGKLVIAKKEVAKNGKRLGERDWGRITAKAMKAVLMPFRGACDHSKQFRDAKNPCAGHKIAKLWGDSGPEKRTYKVVPFTSADRKNILDALARGVFHTREIDATWSRMLVFWWYTGLRLGELAGLCSDRIDWHVNKETGRREPYQVRVTRQMIKGELIERVKTGTSNREVPLLPAAVEALLAQVSLNAKRTDRTHNHVWFSQYSGRPWAQPAASLQPLWVKLLDAAGVQYRNIEQCRHTCATMLLGRGERHETVADVLGHKNSKITQEVYGKRDVDPSAANGYKWHSPIPYAASDV